MIESCLRIVPVVENTTLLERGKRKKIENGGLERLPFSLSSLKIVF